MKELIIWTIFSGLLFISFISFLIIGIIRKNKRFIIASIAILLVTVVTGFYTGYKLVTKSYKKVTTALKPRTGNEIYISLFGKPESDCLSILNSQDQVIPKIDYAIWLHFKTCPNELKRILSKHNFVSEKISTKYLYTSAPSENENWFKPELLGDTILIYKYSKDQNGNGQTIYSNLNQTEVYCIDVLD